MKQLIIALLLATSAKAAVSVGGSVAIGVVPISGGTFTGAVTISNCSGGATPSFSVQQNTAGTAVRIGDCVTTTNWICTAAGATTQAANMTVSDGGVTVTGASTITASGAVPLGLTRTTSSGTGFTVVCGPGTAQALSILSSSNQQVRISTTNSALSTDLYLEARGGVIRFSDLSVNAAITIGATSTTLTSHGTLALTGATTSGTVTLTSPSTGTTAIIANATGPSTSSIFEVQQSSTARYLFAPATANSITFDADGYAASTTWSQYIAGTGGSATASVGSTAGHAAVRLSSTGGFTEITSNLNTTNRRGTFSLGIDSTNYGFLTWDGTNDRMELGSIENIYYKSFEATLTDTGHIFTTDLALTTAATFGTASGGNITHTIPGAAPASVAGNGTAAIDFTFTGPAGGASSGVTGQTGGTGSDSTETLGAGGAVAGAGGIGGKGGSKTITTGVGGAGATTNGDGGDISFVASASGAGGGTVGLAGTVSSTIGGNQTFWSGVESSATADSNVSGATTASFATTAVLPANSMRVGRVLRVTARGVATTDGAAGNLTMDIRIGSTVIITTGAQTAPNNLSDRGWELSADIVCRTVGAGGTLRGAGFFTLATAATTTQQWDMEQTAAATTAIDTTASNTFDIQVTNSDAGTTMSSQTIIWEVLN